MESSLGSDLPCELYLLTRHLATPTHRGAFRLLPSDGGNQTRFCLATHPMPTPPRGLASSADGALFASLKPLWSTSGGTSTGSSGSDNQSHTHSHSSTWTASFYPPCLSQFQTNWIPFENRELSVRHNHSQNNAPVCRHKIA